MNKATHEALERYIKYVTKDKRKIIQVDLKKVVEGIFDAKKNSASKLSQKKYLLVIGPCELSSPEKMCIDYIRNHNMGEIVQLIDALVHGDLRASLQGAIGKLKGKSINIASNMGWGYNDHE